ncbi:extracellular solute-binding protein [Microbispora sp. NEAU-D428]|uniref:extracellular solute-binding protein n=1 Tax=Microbispora sitophila TaxID=2771537 RepID=UPI001865BA17|nr:extracellular solute-binding protein [Microbispora sitophila]MBE3010648.1 extracellular solute-binding protein [Microbispora sitophila]
MKTGAPTEKVALSLVSTPESGAAIKAIIAAFQAEHPNITINYQDTNYDDYNKSLNLSLASGQAPDIALLNSVGTTVKDGLVRSLTPYEQAYGWDKVYPSTQLAQWRVGADGSTLGSGDLYAAPAGFSIVGVYYNKAKATKLGITAPPATLADFESALAKAKAAGEVPLQLGNAQGHASFAVQLIGQSQDGAENAAKWTFGRQGTSFDTPGNRSGAEKLLDWAKKGYLPKDANGVDLQGAVDKFTKGEGVFFIDGNWDAGKIGDRLKEDAGFFAFPGAKATAIGTSVAYAISAKSAHPDAAAAFLDFLHGPQASAEEFKVGFMPADPSAAKADTDTVMAGIVAAWARVNADNGLVGFNNNATATMNDRLTAATQELIGGKTDVTGFIDAIQSEWAKTHG